MFRGLGAGRSLRLLELACVVGAALFALGFHLTLPARLAGDGDWKALGAHLSQHARPGDEVVLHPWWTDEARLHVPEWLPLHGDPHAANRDHVGAERLWVISQPALPRADTDGFLEAFGPGRDPLGAPVRFGTLELRPYRNLRHRPVSFDASRRLADARAWIESAGAAPRRCRRSGDGLSCPGLGRLTSGPHEIDHAPLDCIPVPPPPGEARLVIEFTGVPRSGALLLEGGVVGEQAWKTGGDLGTIAYGLDVEGAPLHEERLPPGSEGLRAATLERPVGGTETLRLWSRGDRPGARVPCVSLRALGAADTGAKAP